MTHAGASGGDQGEDDGYLYSDHLYVDRPEEKFACPICLCPVQRVAHLTSCCGNHFCFKCISRVTNANKACPTCNAAPPVRIFPNKERQREINQLQVQCPLNTEGAQECDWRGELGGAKRHILESHRKDQHDVKDEETKLSTKLQEQCHIEDSREPERPECTHHSAVHRVSVRCTQPVSVQCSVSLSTPNPPTITEHTPSTLTPPPLHTHDAPSTHSPPSLHAHTHPPHHPHPHHQPPHHFHHPHHPPPHFHHPHHPPPHHFHHPHHPHPHHFHHPHHPYPHHHPHPHHFPHRPRGCRPHH